MSYFSSYKHQVIAVSLTNLLVSLHGVRRVKCHGQNMNSEWYGRSKDFYKKSQSRLEALILMKCSIYLLQVIKSCDVKCPEADTRLHLKNLLQHVAESVSKRLKSKVSENDQTFQFLFKKSLEPVDIILPQVKKELS